MQEKNIARRIAALKEFTLFAGLTEKEIVTLVDDLRLKEYGRDEIIFRQGDESRELYLILKGKVRIYKISPSGEETSIAIFFDHDVLAEMAALESLPRSATAKAISPVQVLIMSQERFLYHLRTMPTLGINLARVLSIKLRWTSAYAESIAQFDAAGRLLQILLHHNSRYGQAVEVGKRYVVDLALNQSDLASMVGARREWVNRLLSDWRKRGLLEFENGVITILDLPRVEAERDSRIEANQHSAEW
jgi:CRP/FNR family transcriptional regulator, cyclic AMP receptor protein